MGMYVSQSSRTLQSAVVSFELFQQRQFNAGQMYVALSRVTNIDGLYLIGDYNKSAIRVNVDAGHEYERLRNSNCIKHTQNETTSSDQLKISLLNIRSIRKHAIDLVENSFIMDSDFLGLTETQLNENSDTSVIQHTLQHHFNITYNNSSINCFQNSALCHKPFIEILECNTVSGFSLVKFRKETFSVHPIQLLLLYRQPNLPTAIFYDDLAQLVRCHDISIIMGDFNIDALDPENDYIKNMLSSYQMIVHEPTHLAGGLLDHAYVKTDFLNRRNIRCSVKSVYFSDHDSVVFSIL